MVPLLKQGNLRGVFSLKKYIGLAEREILALVHMDDCQNPSAKTISDSL
jgi:hypothetical protein